MPLYREHGVVLRTYRLGEADRIVVFITRGRGKVRAVAKGVRKTKSRFGGRLEPTSHVALQLYEGRELDIVTQAESVDHFRAVREDLGRFATASSMLEVVDQVAQEHHADVRLYSMLVGALRALESADRPLLLSGFFLKVLAHEGLAPDLGVCVDCGSEDVVAIDFEDGAVRCHDDARGLPVSPEALSLLRLILDNRLSAVLHEPRSPATVEVANLAARAMEHHLERRLRSIAVDLT